jgi:hypothetical protein
MVRYVSKISLKQDILFYSYNFQRQLRQNMQILIDTALYALAGCKAKNYCRQITLIFEIQKELSIFFFFY